MSDEERKRNKSFSVSYTWWWLCPRFCRASGVGGEVVKWREGMFHDESRFTRLHCSPAAFRQRREERER